MATLPGGTLPGGYYAYGGNAPSSEVDGTGAYIYGVTSKDSAGQICYTIWRATRADGSDRAVLWHSSVPGMHRGSIKQESDGRLILTIYTAESDKQPVERIPIPGYIPRIDSRMLVLEQRMDELETAIANIQLTPGPQGPMGATGPQGEPGLSGGGGALDEEQTKAVAWLVRLLRRLEVLL